MKTSNTLNLQPDRHFIAVYIPEFPAQVLAGWDHDLANQAYVVTRQDTDNDRSRVVSLSPAAGALGLYPGQPLQKIKKEYKKVKILKEDRGLEKRARKEMIMVGKNYSPAIDKGRFKDIMVLNMCGARRCYGSRFEFLEEMVRRDIKQQIGFKTVWVGSATSAFISGLCARSAGRLEIKKCEPGFESLVLADMRVGLLPGLPKTIRERLRNMNLKKIGDIQDKSKDFLISRLGEEGERVYWMVRGVHLDSRKKKSPERIQANQVFDVNTNDLSRLDSALQYVADQLSFKLRQHRKKTPGLTLAITFSDSKTSQHTSGLRSPSWEFSDIYQEAGRLFNLVFTRRVAVKKIDLASSRLQPDNGQLNLFETRYEKKHKKVARALYAVREKFGFNSILNAKAAEYISGSR